MQVKVFITRGDGQNKLLVLPMSPQSAIPPQYQIGWVCYASVSTGDALFGEVDASTIEDGIAARGYALVHTKVLERR